MRAGTDEVLVLVASVLRVENGDEVMLDSLELELEPANDENEEDVKGAAEDDDDCLELELKTADEELGHAEDVEKATGAEFDDDELEVGELGFEELNNDELDVSRIDEGEVGREELDITLLSDGEELAAGEDGDVEVGLEKAAIELEAMPSTLEAEEVGLVNRLPSHGPRTPRLL